MAHFCIYYPFPYLEIYSELEFQNKTIKNYENGQELQEITKIRLKFGEIGRKPDLKQNQKKITENLKLIKMGKNSKKNR